MFKNMFENMFENMFGKGRQWSITEKKWLTEMLYAR